MITISRPASSPDDCVSELTLDRLIAGELDPACEAVVRGHLATCAGCRGQLDEIETSRAEFASLPVRLEFRRPRSWRWHLPSVTAVVVAAAAVAVVVLARRPPGIEGPGARPGTQTKGGARLGLFVQHGERIREGTSGERIEPGDTLQFTVSILEPRYVAVLSVDGAGRASIYFPDGPVAVEAEVGRDVVLPASTVVDGVLGKEEIFGLFCGAPEQLEPVRAGLETHPDAPVWPPGCEVDRLRLDKREGL